MPESKPSYCTSTLSQAFIGSCVFYALAILFVTLGLILHRLDVETAKLVIGWASAFQVAISSAYLTARKVGNGEGKPAEPVQPVEPVKPVLPTGVPL